MIDYPLILVTKYKGAQWSLNGDDYDGLVWLDKTPKPSKKELDGLWGTVLEESVAEKKAKATKKQALLDRIGITADDLKVLLG